MAGLTKIDGYYYLISTSGKIATGKTNVWKTNCDLPTGTYEFGADGRILDGIVEKDGVLCCYVMGKPKASGLFELDGKYYFVSGSNGELVVGKSYYVWETNGIDIPMKTYEFDSEGKMLNGFFEKDGVKYYYVDGKPAPVGLNYVDGYYYFVKYDGSLVCSQSYYVWETNGLSIEMTYVFDENGRIIG